MTATTTVQRIGVTRVVNAAGIYTDLGGSRLSPTVWAAATEVNATWASIPDLLDRTGARIAQLVGAEAARVVPGASAALALTIGACIAGSDGGAMERLPATDGRPDELVMQAGHRYKYTRCAAMAGARVVEAGSPDATSADDLGAAISERTAAVLFPAHLEGHNDTLPLDQVVEIAHARGVPVIVDAAYLSYPTELIGSYTAAGADAACFSAKYFYGPNAGGFVLGTTKLVAAVEALDFTRFESGPHLIFGRAFKLDRATIVATLVALEEWLDMDHDLRLATYAARVQTLLAGLRDVPGLDVEAKSFTLDERLVQAPVNALVVRPVGGDRSARQIETALAEGDPAIVCVRLGDALVFAVETLDEDDEQLIIARLRELAGT